MSKNNDGFFEWVVSLFKKKKPPVKIQPTYEELLADAKWINIKAKYSIEYLKEHNAWFVKYMHKNGEWWYLRRWSDDYTLERARGNAIRIADPNQLDTVIKMHQEWIDGGHIFMSFD
jgi:hypothetical protein